MAKALAAIKGSAEGRLCRRQALWKAGSAEGRLCRRAGTRMAKKVKRSMGLAHQAGGEEHSRQKGRQ